MNLKESATRDEKDKAITFWLIGEEKILSDILK